MLDIGRNGDRLEIKVAFGDVLQISVVETLLARGGAEGGSGPRKISQGGSEISRIGYNHL